VKLHTKKHQRLPDQGGDAVATHRGYISAWRCEPEMQ